MTANDNTIRDRALQVLFDENLDAVYLMRPDGTFIDANSVLVTRLGYSHEELLTIDFTPSVAEDNVELVSTAFQAAVAGRVTRFEATGQRRDGSTFRADAVNAPVVVDGTVVAVLGIARDIDDIRDAQQAQVSMEERLQSTLNALSDGLFFLDGSFCFTYVNPRGEEIAQRSRDQLVGSSLWDVFPQMVGSEFGIGYRKAMTEGRMLVVRDRYEPYNVVLEAAVHPVNGGLAISVRDVTEEEEGRQQLREREKRIASQAGLLDSSRDAMIARSLDNRIEYWNRAASELYGWTAEEATGRFIRDLLYPDSGEAFDAATRAVIENGEWHGDIEQTARSGRRIIADCRWSLVRGTNGDPDTIFAVNTDVTEMRATAETAARADRMESLGTLAGGIAHDLNNVLTPMLMSVQLLSMEESNESKRATLAILETSIKRGADMIRQVLTFARGVDGRRIPVDIGRLLRDAEAFCRESMAPAITVSLDLDPAITSDDWTVIGDPTQLLQVLVNLATNARDAMHAAGTLAFEGRLESDNASADWLVISVTDSGPGVPAEVASRMFEPFFTTKGVGRGTGLGLATSSTIVRGYGGELTLAGSESGAVFEIRLPAIRHAPRVEVEVARDLLGASERGHEQLVLVVDDEEAIRASVRTMLHHLGYRSAVASNGEEALEYLTTFPGTVDLVLTDLTMPVMDGAVLIETLGQRTPTLPVIVMTGVTDMELTNAPRLAKPFTAAQLAVALDRAIVSR